MNCPICSVPLQMSERLGIEIDYCPQCRGIWLDRGELDKIIERSSSETPPRDTPRQQDGYYEDKHHGHDEHHDDYRYGKKRKGFLSELFD